MINAIANPQMPKVGERFLGTVVKTTTFGAFVSLLPGRDGLLHITKLRKLAGGKRVDKVEDVVNVGDKLQVEIAEIDNRGKLSLVPVVDGARTRRRRRQPTRPAERLSRGSASSVTALLAADQPVGSTRTLLRADRRRTRSAAPCCPAACGSSPSASRRCARRPFGVWVGRRVPRRDPAPARVLALPRAPAVQGHRPRTALEISPAIDAVGGELNAFTAKEYTCYYAHVLDADLPLAVDVVCDVVTSALAARADDVESERDVVLEEIAMHDDDPADSVHDVFAQAVFGDTPLGRPILGTADSISGLTRTTINGYYRRNYTLEQPRGRRRGQRRPRRRRPHGEEGLRPASSPRPTPRSAAPAARRAVARPRARPGVHLDQPPHRAGQPGPRRAGLVAHRRPALRPRRAQRGARRRHVLSAVPGGPGEARPGLLRVLLHRSVRRRRAVRRLRRLRCPSKVDQVLDLCRTELARVVARRHHRATSSTAARASCAARSCSAWRTPARG